MGHHGVHRFCIAKNIATCGYSPEYCRHCNWTSRSIWRSLFNSFFGTDVGTVIIRRADDFAAYKLAVTVDNADQKNTHIVRGRNILNSTPEQIYLQRTLGFTTPQYAHLALVLDKDGHQLSKSLAAYPGYPGDPVATLRLGWQFFKQSPISWPPEHNPEHAIFHAIKRFCAGKIPTSPQLPTP